MEETTETKVIELPTKVEPKLIYVELLNTLMRYPVGENIQENIPKIKSMVEAFLSINEFEGRKINIICRGSSGAIIAGIFALSIPKGSIVHFKKEGERAHKSIPDFDLSAVNIIVDDFICTGNTLNNIYKELVNLNKGQDVTIDCVCISGDPYSNRIAFTPRYIVCGKE